MEQIKSFLRNCLCVTDDDIIQTALKVAYIQNVPRKEFLYRQGDKLSGVPFLMSGLFRFYFTDIKGTEHTDCFCGEPGFPIIPSIELDSVLPIDIQALEDSKVLIIPAALIENLVDNNIDIMRIQNKLLTLSLKRHWETKMALYQYNAEARYLWFLEKYGELIHRIPHIYIASFLNISPVTLSRIRRKLKMKYA